jgi:hypothetical protein
VCALIFLEASPPLKATILNFSVQSPAQPVLVICILPLLISSVPAPECSPEPNFQLIGWSISSCSIGFSCFASDPRVSWSSVGQRATQGLRFLVSWDLLCFRLSLKRIGSRCRFAAKILDFRDLILPALFVESFVSAFFVPTDLPVHLCHRA